MCIEVINGMADTIAELEKKLAEREWIPCSERLPLKEQDILATTTWGYVTIANRWFGDNWFIHEGNSNAKTSDIIAWMPLPKPYREDGEA